MARNPSWTDAEIAILQAHYTTHDNAQLAAILPCRTPSSISTRLTHLGLVRHQNTRQRIAELVAASGAKGMCQASLACNTATSAERIARVLADMGRKGEIHFARLGRTWRYFSTAELAESAKANYLKPVALRGTHTPVSIKGKGPAYLPGQPVTPPHVAVQRARKPHDRFAINPKKAEGAGLRRASIGNYTEPPSSWAAAACRHGA